MLIKLFKDGKFWSILMPTKNKVVSKPIYHITSGTVGANTEKKSEKEYSEGKAGRTPLLECVKEVIKKVNAQVEKGFEFHMDNNSETSFNELVEFYEEEIQKIKDKKQADKLASKKPKKEVKVVEDEVEEEILDISEEDAEQGIADLVDKI